MTYSTMEPEMHQHIASLHGMYASMCLGSGTSWGKMFPALQVHHAIDVDRRCTTPLMWTGMDR